MGEAQAPGTLDAKAALAGKRILFIGSTGFVGKVALTLLMDKFPEVAKIWCLVRLPRDGRTAPERFQEEVLDSPLFKGLRDELGEEAFAERVHSRVEAVGGDITIDDLGMDPDTADRIAAECDAVINCSGLVDFNPPLNQGISTNVNGVRKVVEFARRTPGESVVHVSTTYVAGTKDGDVLEDPDVVDRCPRQDDLPEGEFSFEHEIEGSLHDIASVEEQATASHLESRFAEAAKRWLESEDRDPDDPEALAERAGRERSRWIDDRLIERGIERAQQWGWPNIYTFTKSLGEQVVASSGLKRWTIVRPSVVESSLSYPFPGWNEGINTSAPLIFLGIKGHTKYPTREGVTLDVVPVDWVAASLIAATAAILEDRHKAVYQVGTSDTNAISVPRMVEFVGLYKRDYYRRRPRGNPWFNRLAAWVEPKPVSLRQFRRTSAPAVASLAGLVSEKLGGKGPVRLAGPGGLRQSLGRGIMGISKTSGKTGDIFDMFLPFIHDHMFTFHCHEMRALLDSLDGPSREALHWDAMNIEWRSYFLDVHCRGLEKWVFPRIKDKIKPRRRDPVRYRDLNHMLRSTTKVHEERTALRLLKVDGSTDRWTYGELLERVDAVAGRLAELGVGQGDRVVLCSANRPEWAATYFGILRAGGVVVPIDRESTAKEIGRLCEASEAKALMVSGQVGERLNGEVAAPRLDVVATCDPEGAPAPPEFVEPDPDDLASLIYTSGTTGDPKGVMLTHANFTFLLQALSKVFKVRESDGMLSALPLHHTFEFACGYLLPLSKGAQIVYLEELDSDMLARAFAGGRVTLMVGVPALWELLHRKVKKQVRDKGKSAERAFDGLMALNKGLRDKFGLNLGKILFAPVHQGFGGRIRFLVSGGATLPPDIQRAFYSMGIDLYEGYGLTEASPVLTVSRPGERTEAGSVGKALPGVELEVLDPDADGVGELVARGENVMKGYLGNPEATAEAIDEEGRLHTGDFARLDDKGRVFIQGRKKEIIVEASGKNVYPDELEELYGGCGDIEEMSVVGIDDGRGRDRVAAMVVVKPDVDDRAEARRRVETHFRDISSSLAGWKRVKLLRFYEGTLPRTATRKVRRKEVAAIFERMLAAERAAAAARRGAGSAEGKAKGGGAGGTEAWLVAAIASACERPAAEITRDTRLVDELGFESLMLTELLAVLETGTGTGTMVSPEALAACVTVGDVLELVEGADVKAPAAKAKARSTKEADDADREIVFPSPVQQLGKALMGRAQDWLYTTVFDTEVKGRGNVPLNRPLLVVSNHQSHLDMGLVKTAMGEAGKTLVSMAASDYFFRPGARQAYFANFTNLVPMDRAGSLKQSLQNAENLLKAGKSVLIFPEGTRSRSGKMSKFKRGVGYLALNAGVDVLPIYLDGTHDALPVGAALPTRRDVGAHVGPVVGAGLLREVTEGLTRHEAYDVATALIEDAVLALRDRRPADPAAAAARVTGGTAPQAGNDQPTAEPKEHGKSHPIAVLFGDLTKSFRPNKVERPLSFYFSLGSEDAAKWTLLIDPESCEIKPGRAVDKADCVLKTDADTFTRIVKEHYMPSFSEFMSGKIKTNSPDLLRTFQKVFGL